MRPFIFKSKKNWLKGSLIQGKCTNTTSIGTILSISKIAVQWQMLNVALNRALLTVFYKSLMFMADNGLFNYTHNNVIWIKQLDLFLTEVLHHCGLIL